MANHIRKLSAGDELAGYPSDAHNYFLGAAKKVYREGRRNGSGQSASVRVVTCIVWNDTAAAIDVDFPVLKLDAPVFTPADNDQQIYRQPEFKGKTPDADTRPGNFAIVQGPLSDDAGLTGRAAVLVGPTYVDVEFTDADHTHAAVKVSDNTQLESASEGIEILWHDTIPGSLPATVRCLVNLTGSAGAEKNRLIRGQSVGIQSGGTLSIDSVIVLSGGLDPSGGNPATVVSVNNLFSQSYTDNEKIQAVYSPEVTAGVDWETLKTSTGTDTFRLIRGLAKGDVTADDNTFVIDNVIPLAGGLDPVSGNAATEITVNQNLTAHCKEAFEDNTPITAVWDGAEWELLVVERYRMIRGELYSGTTTLVIDNIHVLCSGRDPRTDTTSTTETISVENIHVDTYATDDKVVAVYNTELNQWEALRKGGGGSAIRFGKSYGEITAATSYVNTDWGTGMFQLLNDDGTDNGSPVEVMNRYFNSVPDDTPVWIIDVDGTDFVFNAGCASAP